MNIRHNDTGIQFFFERGENIAVTLAVVMLAFANTKDEQMRQWYALIEARLILDNCRRRLGC